MLDELKKPITKTFKLQFQSKKICKRNSKYSKQKVHKTNKKQNKLSKIKKKKILKRTRLRKALSQPLKRTNLNSDDIFI